MTMALDGRKERFAQLIAAGSSQTAAYKAAGYKGEGSTARSGAARLAAREEVKYRIRELQDQQLLELRERQADAATAAGIDLEWLERNGKDLFHKAVEDKDYTAASQTFERIAKVAGLWMDRSSSDGDQVLRIYSDRPLSEEEWLRLYAPHNLEDPDDNDDTDDDPTRSN
jgi:hypothetical protein